MSSRWHFRERRPGDDYSNPISGEFFSDGSLDSPASALVREALQNADDAGRGIERGSAPVHVRITLHSGNCALPSSVGRTWFEYLLPHLRSSDSGIRRECIPDLHKPMDCLLVEDFGTCGLTGDYLADRVDGGRNNFVDFMRSDARHHEQKDSLGSWGVGKNVFPRSSRVNAFVAFTTRHEDMKTIAMGKCILQIRNVEGRSYQPSCYLAASWDSDKVPHPITDANQLVSIRRDFCLTRCGEPGLSVAIPWLDPDITFDSIREAVLSQFYFAILADSLRVTLSNGSETIDLNSDSLMTYSAASKELSPIVALASRALRFCDQDRFHLSPPPSREAAQKWGEELIDPAIRDAINSRLQNREVVTVRAHLAIRPKARPKATPSIPASFDIYLEHADGERRLKPAFFRKDLLISNPKGAPGAPGVRAMVVVDDGPLAELLRAAEPPNHTDWDPKTRGFKDLYYHGPGVIQFVKRSVVELMGLVRASANKPDPSIALDFFSLPEPNARAFAGRRATKRDGSGAEVVQVDRKEVISRFTIADVQDGFAIRPGSSEADPPATLLVEVAYDVLNGIPWKQWEPADFYFGLGPEALPVRAEGGAKVLGYRDNSFRLRISSRPFEVLVTGFDPNRDLIVRATDPTEPIHVDSSSELHET